MAGAHLANYKWNSATAPRGTNPGGMSKQERAFRDALHNEFIPEAASVLRDMLSDSRDVTKDDEYRERCRMDFMKCCGLIRKQTDTAAIQEVAQALLDGMLEEARARRAGGG